MPVPTDLLEDDLCRAFAEKTAQSEDFKNWVLSRTKFSGDRFFTRVLKDEQIAARPNVLPNRWWRHWWWKIPDLDHEYETDVFLVLGNEKGAPFALHTEVKLGSGFSPGQAQSYHPRAEYVMAHDGRVPHQDFATVLVAPRQLLDRSASDAALFDCVFLLDELAVFMAEFAQAVA